MRIEPMPRGEGFEFVKPLLDMGFGCFAEAFAMIRNIAVPWNVCEIVNEYGRDIRASLIFESIDKEGSSLLLALAHSFENFRHLDF